jgi:hypothetical protein
MLDRLEEFKTLYTSEVSRHDCIIVAKLGVVQRLLAEDSWTVPLDQPRMHSHRVAIVHAINAHQERLDELRRHHLRAWGYGPRRLRQGTKGPEPVDPLQLVTAVLNCEYCGHLCHSTRTSEHEDQCPIGALEGSWLRRWETGRWPWILCPMRVHFTGEALARRGIPRETLVEEFNSSVGYFFSLESFLVEVMRDMKETEAALVSLGAQRFQQPVNV